MDFLTHLSVRYSNGHVCDEEDPDDEAGLIEQMNNYIRPTYKDNKTLMGQMDRIVKPEDYKEVELGNNIHLLDINLGSSLQT